PASRISASAALAHLEYLSSYWMSVPMWNGWSQFGRNRASEILGVAVEGVLPTTNHLESFNSALKGKYLPQWQRSGARLRFDVLIFRLVRDIVPTLF
ncbi:hypothetical protein OF83DRAFT_1039767, partial [Amylostereum chailletii]